MNHRRTLSLVIVLAISSAVGSAFAKKEGRPNQLNYQENAYGGVNGSPRVIQRSWQRPDGARVSERLTFGVKMKQFKHAQHGVALNTGLEAVDRTTDGNLVKTVVSRTVKGENKGTKTVKTWKSGRYEFEFQHSTRANEVPRRLRVSDRVTSSNVIITVTGRKADVTSSKYGKGDDDLIAEMTERGKAVLKARKR